MSDSSSWVMVSTGRATPSSVVAGNLDSAGGMDQITVVRIDDTHIAGEQSHVGGKVKDEDVDFYEVEYSMPTEEEEEAAAGEEEEDDVYVIEYSNPEEEGESYQFTMSVDRSLPDEKPRFHHPVVTEDATAPSLTTSKPARTSRPRQEVRRRRPTVTDEEEEELVSNKSVLELGEDYRDVMCSGRRQLVCSLCPPPGKFFKRASGLAVHLKQMHRMEGKKTFFCTSCKQTVRTQVELDAHTRRHANQDAVFTCRLCSEASGFRGSRWGLRRHLEKEHPGVVPRCHVCNKGFKTLASYLADQFRHVGVSPFYCPQCQIYEMTERGLSVHIKNHDKKKKKKKDDDQTQESTENNLTTLGVSGGADNSATDDSDF